MSADRELIERARRASNVPWSDVNGIAITGIGMMPREEWDRLLALASAGADANEATDEFNAGFECAKAGGKITDEPNHCPQDEWRNGFLCGDYERHAAAARLAGVRDGLSAAASVAAEWASGPTCDPSGEPCKCKRTADSIETRVRSLDAAAVAARGRG